MTEKNCLKSLILMVSSVLVIGIFTITMPTTSMIAWGQYDPFHNAEGGRWERPFQQAGGDAAGTVHQKESDAARKAHQEERDVDRLVNSAEEYGYLFPKELQKLGKMIEQGKLDEDQLLELAKDLDVNQLSSLGIQTQFVTNRDVQQNNVAAGGWVVAYGDEFPETKLIEGAVIAYYAPDEIGPWMQKVISDSEKTLETNVQNKFTEEFQAQAEAFATEEINNLLQGKREGKDYMPNQQVEFKAGVVKYTGHNKAYIPKVSGGGHQSGGYWVDAHPFDTMSYQPYIAMKIKGGAIPGQPIIGDCPEGQYYSPYTKQCVQLSCPSKQYYNPKDKKCETPSKPSGIRGIVGPGNMEM